MEETNQSDCPFVVGDVVQLLSGGPKMVVTHCMQHFNYMPWTCSLIYADNDGHITRERSVEATFLRKA